MNNKENQLILDFINELKEGDFLELNLTFDLLASSCTIIQNKLTFGNNDIEIIKIFSKYYFFKDNKRVISLIYNNIEPCFELLSKLKIINIKNNQINILNYELVSLLTNAGNSLIFMREIALRFKEYSLLSNSFKNILSFFLNKKNNEGFLSFVDLFNNNFVNEFYNLEITNKQISTIKFLQEFGVINNITNEEKLIKLINENKSGYIGFDPTAESLHLGNYVMINTMNRLSKSGLHILPMVGGATGMIGDPSGKTSERKLLNEKNVLLNKEKIKQQLLKYTTQKQILDNYDNFKDMSFLIFLRDVGKHVNINYLLEKEIIKSRLSTGISFTEFTYTIMQGYDFLCFYKSKDISLQIGGSDQWGNITTGIEMIRKMHSEDNTATGITINLLTKSDGTKFGKSEKGAIFLDPELTTPYEMYQFLINQADNDLIKLLIFLTDINPYHISLLQQIIENKNLVQFKLLQAFLTFKLINEIHSNEEYQRILRINNALFNGMIDDLTLDELDIIFKVIPNNILKKENKYEFYDLLVKTNICKSNREAREFILNNSISINGKKINDVSLIITKSEILFNQYTLIKKGKKNYYIIKWE